MTHDVSVYNDPLVKPSSPLPLTQMRKDIHGREPGKKSKVRSRKEQDTDSIDVDGWLGCEEDLTVLKLEFIMVS